jgi:hypothetical protein
MLKTRLIIGSFLIFNALHLQAHAEFGPQSELDNKPAVINLNESRYPDILKKNYIGFGKMSLSSALQTILPKGLTYKLQNVSPTVTAQWDQSNVPFYKVLDQIADHLNIEWHYREGLILFSPIGAVLDVDRPVVVKTNIAVIPEASIKPISVAPAVEPAIAETKSAQKQLPKNGGGQAQLAAMPSAVATPSNSITSAEDRSSQVRSSASVEFGQSDSVTGKIDNASDTSADASSAVAVSSQSIRAVLVDEPQGPEQKLGVKSSKAVKPIAAPKTTKHWSIKAGSMLSASIEEWAKEWGWTMLWKVDNDFRIAYAVEIVDDFLGGVSQVLDAYSATAHPLWGDAHDVQKLLVIKAADGSAVSISSR